MQAVAGIVVLCHQLRLRRIAQRGVGVGHRVEHAGMAYPVVERLAVCFVFRFRMVVAAGLVGRDRGADQADAVRVGAFGKLAVGRLQVGQQLLAVGRQVRRVAVLAAQIVHADQHQRVRDAGARQHVAVEAGGQAGAQAVAQHAAAADAGVDHADRRAALAQARGQCVGPARVAVRRHAVAVGDRVAHDHQRAGRGRGPDLDIGQHIPVGDAAGVRPGGVHHAVALGEEAGGARTGMAGLARRFALEIQRNRQVGGRLDGHVDGVAVIFGAGGDHHGAAAVKGQRMQGGGVDIGLSRLRQRDAGPFHHQWRAAVGVADADPQTAASQRQAHDLPQAGVAPVLRGQFVRRFRQLLRRTPGGDPVLQVLRGHRRAGVQ